MPRNLAAYSGEGRNWKAPFPPIPSCSGQSVRTTTSAQAADASDPRTVRMEAALSIEPLCWSSVRIQRAKGRLDFIQPIFVCEDGAFPEGTGDFNDRATVKDFTTPDVMPAWPFRQCDG